MSDSYEGASGTPVSGSPQSPGTVETAKHEAAQVKDTAASEAGHVVETAKSEVGAVAHEAKSQVKDLYGQTVSELRDQAGVQQRRVAEGLRSVGGELSTMAENADGGIAADLVRQASSRIEGVAGWIGDRDPGSLLTEVKTYARRKPGTFIAVAALAGLVAGRLTRALTESAADAKSDAGSTAGSVGGSVGGATTATDFGTPAAADGAYAVGGALGSANDTGLDATAPGVAGSGAATTGSGTVGDPWAPDSVDAAIPPAPDGVSGTDVGTDQEPATGDTPLYDQTGTSSRDPFAEDRP